jgi:cytoskeletal protein CcmA (bactofilin family)
MLGRNHMWRKSDEAKPSAPGANAAEPAATTLNTDSPATPATEISTSAAATAPPVASAPAASVAAASASTAADMAAALANVATISSGLKIRGDISGNCHLIIEGEAHGKIHLVNGRVTVGPTGRVHSDIEAPEISIEGTVQGNLRARDSVRMGPTSHVQGSVLSTRIRIEDGASFRGKVEMIRPGETVPSSSTASSQTPKAAVAAGPRG